MSSERTSIGCLRVRSTDRRDRGPRLRLRLSSLLAGAHLRPPGLPPSAVLVVRELEDPLPGRVTAHRPAVRPDGEWEAAVRREVGTLYRRAARPALRVPPASAEAVLFLDEAEMLACLAADLARGTALTRWWWSGVLRGLARVPTTERVATLLTQKPRLVPGTFELLRLRGEATEVVESLRDPAPLVVLEAVLREFGVSLPPEPEPPAPPRRRAAPTAPGSADGPVHGSPAVPPAPWEGILPAAATSPELSPSRRLLLEVALALHRAPSLMRSPSVRAGIAVRVGEATGSSPPSADPPRTAPPEGLPPRVLPAEPRIRGPLPPPGIAPVEPPGGPSEFAEERQAQAGADPDPEIPTAERTRERSGDDGSDVSEEHDAPVTRESEAPSGSPPAEAGTRLETPGRELPETPPRDVTTPVAADGSEDSRPPERAEPEPSEPHAPLATDGDREPGGELPATAGSWVETELAGVLYLVNLMEHLELPEVFEESWRLASGPGPWGVLEALGRGLLGERLVRVEVDPLWRLLAALAGREPGTPVADDGLEPAAFEVPPGWLAESDRSFALCRWATRGERLRVWHEAGFLLADLPRGEQPASAQAEEILARASFGSNTVLRPTTFGEAPVEAVSGSCRAAVGPVLARWLSVVLPYIRYRLRGALELGDAEELVPPLLLRHGRVFMTTSHLDLVIPLDSVWLPARVAGLDRDPGWLPAFGRVVLFHFEETAAWRTGS